jgi:hypothetical protein
LETNDRRPDARWTISTTRRNPLVQYLRKIILVVVRLLTILMTLVILWGVAD